MLPTAGDNRRFMHGAIKDAGIRKDFAKATEIIKRILRMCFTLETSDNENYRTLL